MTQPLTLAAFWQGGGRLARPSLLETIGPRPCPDLCPLSAAAVRRTAQRCRRRCGGACRTGATPLRGRHIRYCNMRGWPMSLLGQSQPTIRGASPERCPLRSESDRLAASPRNDAMGQKQPCHNRGWLLEFRKHSRTKASRGLLRGFPHHMDEALNHCRGIASTRREI